MTSVIKGPSYLNATTIGVNSSMDANDFMDIGKWYRWAFANGTPQNTPKTGSATAGTIYVAQTAWGMVQIMFSYTGFEFLYIRIRYSGTWQKWYQISTQAV